MELLFDDFLKLCQVLIIPTLALVAKYVKKQTETVRDIRDLKTYVMAICKDLKITCTLKDN